LDVWRGPLPCTFAAQEGFVVRIFVVDDNSMIRARLRTLLEQRPEWVVVGEASNGRDAVQTLRQLKPHVTVMDFQMPGMDGLEASRQLTKQDPNTPIMMVSVDPSRQLEEEAKKAGAKGICPKSDVRSLQQGLEALLAGKTWFRGDLAWV
jgi:DNA-binding NarL/FixJ family response regulator